MRIHHQLTVTLAIVLAGLGSARGQSPQAARRPVVKDSNVTHAAGEGPRGAVESGLYQTDGSDADSAIQPLSAEYAAEAYAPDDGYGPGEYASGEYPMDGGYPMEPGHGGDPYGAGYGGDPAYNYQRQPGEAPPGMQPWPGISPYDNTFSQHRQEKGLWFHDSNNGQRRWHGGFEYLNVGLEKISSDQQRIGYPIFRNSLSERLHRDLSPLKDNLRTNGIRAFAGWDNPDESGGEFSGFLTGSPDEQHLYAPLSSGGTNFGFSGPGFIPGLLPIYIATINEQTGVEGRPLIFNQALLAEVHAQAWGADANLITTPLLGRGANKVRAVYGFRYLDVTEGLRLTGYDTLFGITTIESIVQSRMFGPQAGLRWDLGGSKLKLISQFKVGALGNFEKINLNATNYFLDGAAFPINSRLEGNNRRISPMLEFSFQAEAPLFGYLPVFKKIPVVRDGIFRIGYTYTATYLMNRPSGVITYADPAPRIDDDRTDYSVQWMNVGIDWKW
jgi:hypothetical protein